MLTSCSCPQLSSKQHRSIYGEVFLAILIPLYYASWRYHTAHTPPKLCCTSTLDRLRCRRARHAKVQPMRHRSVLQSQQLAARPDPQPRRCKRRRHGNILDLPSFATEAGRLNHASRHGQSQLNRHYLLTSGPIAATFDEAWLLTAAIIFPPANENLQSRARPYQPQPLCQRITQTTTSRPVADWTPVPNTPQSLPRSPGRLARLRETILSIVSGRLFGDPGCREGWTT